MCGVVQEQEHRADRAVTLFEGDPAFQGLNVAHVRFGLDPDGPTWTVDRRIPRTMVYDAGGRKLQHRHLGSPAQTGPKSFPKSRQKRELCTIPDRTPRWIRSARELEPEDRQQL